MKARVRNTEIRAENVYWNKKLNTEIRAKFRMYDGEGGKIKGTIVWTNERNGRRKLNWKNGRRKGQDQEDDRE